MIQLPLQSLMRNRLLILVIGIFTIFNILVAFFIDSNTVFIQTLYGLIKIALLLVFINIINVELLQWRFIKYCLAGYWIGLAHLYAINGILYDNIGDWMQHFNDYNKLSFIFSCSTIGTIIYSFKRLG